MYQHGGALPGFLHLASMTPIRLKALPDYCTRHLQRTINESMRSSLSLGCMQQPAAERATPPARALQARGQAALAEPDPTHVDPI